jgi:protein required for attachment to host cells
LVIDVAKRVSMKTWIAVAHRAGARILEHLGPGKPLTLVEEIDHADGRLKNGEINADRPGRAFDRLGNRRHALEREESPQERVASDFAREVAARLRDGRTQQRFAQLVLVAEPRFLGMLRSALDPVCSGMLAGTVNKDLAHVEVRDLPPHLKDLLPV